MINKKSLRNSLKKFKKNKPFDHCVVDNFLTDDILKKIIKEFPKYDENNWHVYKNQLEDKKTLNAWYLMSENTYALFQYLNSYNFVKLLSKELNVNLISDSGLHGGGLHTHGNGGKLNPHLDYSIHPKIGFERFLNLIIYISPNLKEKHGGHLGFWKHNKKLNAPDELVKEIFPKLNRAIIFRTNQNSWHGLSRPLTLPKGVFRNSLAIYYLKKPSKNAVKRARALYAPQKEQIGNKEIEKLIKLRSGLSTAKTVYKIK